MSQSNGKSDRARRRTAALTGLGLLSVALAGAATIFAQRLSAERDRNESLQAQIAHLEKEKSALQASFARRAALGPEGRGLGGRSPVSPATNASGDSLESASRTGSVPPEFADRGATTESRVVTIGPNAERANPLRDPATRAVMRLQQMPAMRRMYPDLANELGLSREDADRFIELQVEQQMKMMDESRQLASSGLAPGSGEMKEMSRRLAEARRSSEQELAAQFGPEVAQNWKTYQQSLGARMELRDLQLDLVDAGIPLTREQRNGMVAAMVREQQANAANNNLANRGGGASSSASGGSATRAAAGSGTSGPELMQARLEQTEASYQRLQSAARAVLSAEQFERFDARQRERLEMMRTAAEAARARAPAR